MLEFYNPVLCDDGKVTCYKHHAKFATYYVLPTTPRFRVDEHDKPVMRVIKFRKPIDREDGKKGGCALIFDAEFVVPKDQFGRVTDELQNRVNQQWKERGQRGSAPPVKIAPLPVKRAAAKLQFLDSGGSLVESVQMPVSPSLYGNFVLSCTAMLSEDGTPVAISALKGDGGAVQLAYDLWTTTRLPAISGKAWFRAEKFYSFYQKVDIDWNTWGEDDYTETIHEQLRQSESGGVDIDPGDVTDQKVITAVTDWAWGVLDDAVERMVLGEMPPVSEEKRKVPGGIENLERTITNRKLADFYRSFNQRQNMEWNPAPQGTLPNITSMGANWNDHYAEVEPDDFFRELNINASVNADFEQLPLDSVNVKVSYPRIKPRNQIIMSADDQKKFRAYISRGKTAYKYSYEVNYDNGKKYRSKTMESEENNLRINIGDLGILDFTIEAGDLNFEQLQAAQVFVEYEDRERGVRKIEKQFMLDAENQEQRFLEVILKPQNKPIRYQVKYIMKDGREFTGAWTESWASPLVINDVWSATKTVTIRAVGDLVEKIDSIYLDLVFTDTANAYTQKKSVALDGDNSSATWEFPVISETGGTVTYAGTIRYFDGTIEEIPQTQAQTDSILAGPKVADIREVEVLPDMIDWDQVNLATVRLKYIDGPNDIMERKTVVFRNGDADSAFWSVDLKDKTRTEYEWQGTFYLFDDNDGNKRPPVKVGPKPTDEDVLLPAMP